MEAVSERALKVAKNSLEGCKMRRTRIVHEKSHLLNGITDVRPGECEIL